YNSLAAIDHAGHVVALYDKIHLVPFGEYLPFQSALEAIGLEQLTRIRGGFSSGARPRLVLKIDKVPSLDPLICYEAIFPGAVVQGTERPNVLLNVTNDGWFGVSSGPYQHFHQARVRAVEEGVPLVRSANNGISAIVTARGQIINMLNLNTIGVLDGEIPGVIPPTLYSRYPDLIFWLLQILLLSILVIAGRNVR
ncbi:MAG: apolipoprotein N-acyltransferase, partial [Hyphomicrobiaceae bacterium]